MRQIVLDQEVRSKLAPGSRFCDEQGQILGYFVSQASYEKYLDAFEAEHRERIAELDLIAQETEEGTLQDLWKELSVE